MPNPFLETWPAPFGAPPFDRIKSEHFAPAYAAALDEHAREIDAIAGNAAAPSFANTIVALEASGRALTRVELVFHNLAASHTNDALQAIEREMAPKLARHANSIHLNAALFARIDALYRARATLGLDSEELRVLERYHLDFVRAGAQLDQAQKTRYAALTERLASLGTEFGQNVLADEQETVIALSEEDVAGLPGFRARGGGRNGPGTGHRGAVCRNDVALQRRADPGLCRQPRRAREGLQGLDQTWRHEQRP